MAQLHLGWGLVIVISLVGLEVALRGTAALLRRSPFPEGKVSVARSRFRQKLESVLMSNSPSSGEFGYDEMTQAPHRRLPVARSIVNNLGIR